VAVVGGANYAPAIEGAMERPLIKFGYDGDWVIRAQRGRADRGRHSASDYADTAFAGRFVPAPIDCKPWVDAQMGGWDLFFSMDVTFMVTDVERGLFSVPTEMSGRIGSFGPFHVGVYSGVRIKTSPGWVAVIDRVADPKTRDALPFTTETAILETDWYTWFKNFVVIRPRLSRLSAMDAITIERGTPLCRVRIAPRFELVACEEFNAEDEAEHKRAMEEYTQAELEMWDQHRFRPATSGQAFYPLYKLRSADYRGEKGFSKKGEVPDPHEGATLPIPVPEEPKSGE
jgi:hypothetical protein